MVDIFLLGILRGCPRTHYYQVCELQASEPMSCKPSSYQFTGLRFILSRYEIEF